MNDYIFGMRKIIGHDLLMCTGVGVIIENEKGEILLQERTDSGDWGIPGGGMNIGEKFIETAKREVYEETGLIINNLHLFGIFSGNDRIIEYPNKDKCCVTSIIFKTDSFEGDLLQITDETKKNVFYNKDNLPSRINEFDKKYVDYWVKDIKEILVD